MNILTLPNQITILRMVLTPIFLVAFVTGHARWAFGLFVFAAITDALDGIIARAFKQKSKLGAYLDPMADKMLLMTGFAALTMVETLNPFPVWITLFVFSRDIIILVSVVSLLLLTDFKIMKPLMLSKFCTTFQIVVVIDALLFNALGIPSPLLTLTLGLALFFTLTSAGHYIYWLLRIVGEATVKEKAESDIPTELFEDSEKKRP